MLYYATVDPTSPLLLRLQNSICNDFIVVLCPVYQLDFTICAMLGKYLIKGGAARW